MAKIAGERWNYYKKNMVPVENQYMGNVDWYKTPQAANEASTMATGDVYKQGTPLAQQTEASMAKAGISPASGASIMKRADVADNLASTAGNADTKARMGTQNEYLKGLQNIVAMGNNQAGTAMGGLSSVANSALSQSEANAEYNHLSSMAPANAAGTAVGLGLDAYDKYSKAS